MTPHLHITGSRHPRPPSKRTAYVDGGVDEQWRSSIDIELSHWIPNHTPAPFRAATSTEICLKFVDSAAAGDIDLVVNNHVDTDGMLSAYALLHPARALAHRATLVQAATMGDFGGWGEPAAQHLFQLLALTRRRLQAERADPQDIYLHAHGLVHRALDGERFAETEAGLAALQAAVLAIEQGRITRSLLAPRLVHYVLPDTVQDSETCLPVLDEPLAARWTLPPQARARLDAERVQLISAPCAGGWLHDLLWPGYAWADTEGVWRPPGLHSLGNGSGSNEHRLDHAPLDLAAQQLSGLESAAGRWTVATALGPFNGLPGRRYPVVMSFMQDTTVAASALPPAQVATVLAAALQAD